MMEHQYPGAISPNEHMLAELMLPDQTHVRTQDWTMFFLHKDTGLNEEEEAAKTARREERKERRNLPEQSDESGADQELYISSEEDEDADLEGVEEGPPLMYVLNLVNTKQDTTAKR